MNETENKNSTNEKSSILKKFKFYNAKLDLVDIKN
jgi:hypothetical protein